MRCCPTGRPLNVAPSPEPARSGRRRPPLLGRVAGHAARRACCRAGRFQSLPFAWRAARRRAHCQRPFRAGARQSSCFVQHSCRSPRLLCATGTRAGRRRAGRGRRGCRLEERLRPASRTLSLAVCGMATMDAWLECLAGLVRIRSAGRALALRHRWEVSRWRDSDSRRLRCGLQRLPPPRLSLERSLPARRRVEPQLSAAGGRYLLGLGGNGGAGTPAAPFLPLALPVCLTLAVCLVCLCPPRPAARLMASRDKHDISGHFWLDTVFHRVYICIICQRFVFRHAGSTDKSVKGQRREWLATTKD